MEAAENLLQVKIFQEDMKRLMVRGRFRYAVSEERRKAFEEGKNAPLEKARLVEMFKAKIPVKMLRIRSPSLSCRRAAAES